MQSLSAAPSSANATRVQHARWCSSSIRAIRTAIPRCGDSVSMPCSHSAPVLKPQHCPACGFCITLNTDQQCIITDQTATQKYVIRNQALFFLVKTSSAEQLPSWHARESHTCISKVWRTVQDTLQAQNSRGTSLQLPLGRLFWWASDCLLVSANGSKVSTTQQPHHGASNPSGPGIGHVAALQPAKGHAMIKPHLK